ncbi:MAG: SDR family NAD(P)-dependent oxidoreductase [Cyclobacteriaceae bacterium]
MNNYNHLKNKVVLITNGNSVFSKKLSMDFAKAGAHIILCCGEFNEKTVLNKLDIENENVDCNLMIGDVNDNKFCKALIHSIRNKYGKLDVLVNNNPSPTYPISSLPEPIRKELVSISKMGIFSFQKLTEAAVSIMEANSNIINNQIIDDTGMEVDESDFLKEISSLKTFTEFYANRFLEKQIKANAIIYPQSFFSADNKSLNQWSLVNDFEDIHANKNLKMESPFLFLASNPFKGFSGKILQAENKKQSVEALN